MQFHLTKDGTEIAQGAVPTGIQQFPPTVEFAQGFLSFQRIDSQETDSRQQKQTNPFHVPGALHIKSGPLFLVEDELWGRKV
jgi:hypothetical protein